MKSLKQKLSKIVASAFESLGAPGDLGVVLDSQRPDLSQFQCNGAMAAAKVLKKNPRDIAAAVLEKIEARPEFEKVTIEGPGFLNMSVTDLYLTQHAVLAGADARLACGDLKIAEKIVIDYGGPNVAKSMHVGHLRSAILGESIKRLLRFLGYEVVADVHLGDWGTQMGMLIVGVLEEGIDPSNLTMEDLERLYPLMSARCKENEQDAEKARLATRDLQQGEAQKRILWERFVALSRDALQRDFGALGVSFDLWYGESRYQEKIPPMLKIMKEKGLLQESQGAQVIHLEAENGKEIPPLLMVKGDGGYLYGTTDMATLQERFEEMGAARVIYVTDKRQSLHFRQIFSAASKMNWLDKRKVNYAAFGTMNGKDGKPFKTRAGGVLRLKDLLEQSQAKAMEKMDVAGIGVDWPAQERKVVAQMVGLAAIKFADLSNHRSTDYIFDLDQFTSFEGRTGPYLLYQAVRIKSILRKAQEAGFNPGELMRAQEAERPLLLAISRIPESLQAAAEGCAPNIICDTAYDLASAFSSFYQKCHILKEKDAAQRQSWLALSAMTLSVMEKLLDLLGLQIPDRM